MSLYTATRTKFTGTLAAGALAAATVATAALGAAPSANATCASFFGIGNSSECVSSPLSIAIAIGNGARAQADGLFGAAVAFGTDAIAATEDAFTFGVAAGDNSIAVARGVFGIAGAFGPRTTAGTYGSSVIPDIGSSLADLGFNIALNLAPNNQVLSPTTAAGLGNIAVNLFGTRTTSQFNDQLAATGVGNAVANVGGNNNNAGVSSGFFSSASNVLGSGNTVVTEFGWLNSAFNLFGSDNYVKAGAGPLTLAGTLFQSNQLVAKQNPGFNINGLRLPDTAAAVTPQRVRPSAATSRLNRTSTTVSATPAGVAAVTASAAKQPTAKPAAARRGGSTR